MVYYSPYVNERYINIPYLIYDYERKLKENYISNFKSNNNSKFFKYL